MFKKGHLAPCGGSRKAKHVWGPSLSYSKGLKQAGRANWVKTAMRARAGGTCGNLNENNPPMHMFEYWVPNWWDCLENIRSCGLVGGAVSLGVGFEVLKNLHHFQCTPPPPTCRSGFEFLSIPVRHHGV